MALIHIFAGSEWKLGFSGTVAGTQPVRGASSVGVVISDSRFPDGSCWKDLLRELEKLGDPPPLIVVDRLADDRLWAEVLNLGAYDLLAKPFDRREVRHAVMSACRRRESEREILPRRKPAVSAKEGPQRASVIAS